MKVSPSFRINLALMSSKTMSMLKQWSAIWLLQRCKSHFIIIQSTRKGMRAQHVTKCLRL